MFLPAFIPTFTDPVAIAAFAIVKQFEKQLMVVYFVKRTDDMPRRMACVWRQTDWTARTWDPSAKELLNVLDVEKGDFRFISMDAVEKIVVGGKTFYPTPSEKPLLARSYAEVKAEIDDLFY